MQWRSPRLTDGIRTRPIAYPGTRHFGSLRSNSLRGPSFKEFNFSIFKNTRDYRKGNVLRSSCGILQHSQSSEFFEPDSSRRLPRIRESPDPATGTAQRVVPSCRRPAMWVSAIRSWEAEDRVGFSSRLSLSSRDRSGLNNFWLLPLRAREEPRFLSFPQRLKLDRAPYGSAQLPANRSPHPS